MTGEELRRKFEGITIEGRYYLKKMLASGGFGAVFHGEHRIFDRIVRDVAVKITLQTGLTAKDIKDRFGEAIVSAEVYDSLAGTAAAKYLVPVHDIGVLHEHEDRGFIVMGLVRGVGSTPAVCRAPKTLAETIGNWEATGAAGAMDYLKRICEVVGALHALRVIHRDLKPDNILFSEHGQIRLVDLGLAAHLTPEGYVYGGAGTHLYMAPETGLEDRSTTASDVYALGLIAYELLAGTNPFATLHPPPDLPKEEHCVWMQRKKRDWPPIPPSNHRPRLAEWQDRLVLRCLRSDPEERPHDALEMLKAIEAGRNEASPVADGTGWADWFSGQRDWAVEKPSLEAVIETWGGKAHNKVWFDAATRLAIAEVMVSPDLRRAKILLRDAEEVLLSQFGDFSSRAAWYGGIAAVMEKRGKATDLSSQYREKERAARGRMQPPRAVE